MLSHEIGKLHIFKHTIKYGESEIVSVRQRLFFSLWVVVFLTYNLLLKFLMRHEDCSVQGLIRSYEGVNIDVMFHFCLQRL